MEDKALIAFQAKIREAYKQQKHSKCIEYIDQAPENIRETSQYKILKASCINNIGGRSSQAHKILDSVINDEPNSAFAYYSKGLVFINDGMLEESVKCFAKAIEIDPSEKMDKALQMKTRAENMLRSIKKEPKKEPRSSKSDRVDRSKPQRKSTLDNEEGEGKYCQVCNKTFAKTFSLSRHMLLHTGERPHKCHVCGYAFIQKSDLGRHLATHSDIANFECSTCFKRFKTKKNLHCHSITHSTLRPFKCRFCEKSFKLKRLLAFHEGSHKDVKPYNCDICGKGFPAKVYIKTHLKSHIAARQGQVKVKKEKSDPIVIKTEIFCEEAEMVGSSYSKADIVRSVMDQNDNSLTFGDIVCDPEESTDLNFCLSLLKDITRMTEEQKTKFKVDTIANINKILN